MAQAWSYTFGRALIGGGVRKYVLGFLSVSGPRWFNEEIEKMTRLKKEAKKRYEQTRDERDRDAYRSLNRETKKMVAIAKSDAYDQLYTELDTKEGKGKIFRLAKQRQRYNLHTTNKVWLRECFEG